MKCLIVGLGNPGPEYELTRHNIGFRVIDALQSTHNGTPFKLERYGWVSEYSQRGQSVHLLKPNTFMNLSGMAVRYWLQALKLKSDQLLIVTDDLSLPFGKLRLKPKGSGGGHNGLGSIETLLASVEYPRLRFGIGNDFAKGKQVEYVLSRFNANEEADLPGLIEKASKGIELFSTQGLAPAMNATN